jgi:hypothetical protein
MCASSEALKKFSHQWLAGFISIKVFSTSKSFMCVGPRLLTAHANNCFIGGIRAGFRSICRAEFGGRGKSTGDVRLSGK